MQHPTNPGCQEKGEKQPGSKRGSEKKVFKEGMLETLLRKQEFKKK